MDLPSAPTVSENGWFPVFVTLFAEHHDRSQLEVEKNVNLASF